jgi:hypothetical protein
VGIGSVVLTLNLFLDPFLASISSISFFPTPSELICSHAPVLGAARRCHLPDMCCYDMKLESYLILVFTVFLNFII